MTLNDFSDRLMNPREEVISDRVVELHFERSEDFGQDVQCFAANSAGSDYKRETIPGIGLEMSAENIDIIARRLILTAMPRSKPTF